MLGLLAIWLMFAMALNWGDADPAIFSLLVGTVDGIASGELWRLFTAPLLHMPGEPFHVVGVLIGLFFLTPSLEQRWGSRRLLIFLGMSAVFAYSLQFLVLWAVPTSLAEKLGSQQFWCGGFPAVEAVAVAWALTFSGQTVRLFFVLPVTGRGMLLFIVGFSFLRLVAIQHSPEGLISPFGGLLAGLLFGSGTPSPFRRLYLKLRYSQLQRAQDNATLARGKRIRKSSLQVIEGGRGRSKKSGSDDDPGPGGYLN